ncbi:hypothetical protein [Streptomyces sp. NPDC048643]|uniref:hypothetical protein n=1 Tax=Streptomyces sp. NPDC048643 TaxID=3155637 RepID=UPI003422470A
MRAKLTVLNAQLSDFAPKLLVLNAQCAHFVDKGFHLGFKRVSPCRLRLSSVTPPVARSRLHLPIDQQQEDHSAAGYLSAAHNVSQPHVSSPPSE